MTIYNIFKCQGHEFENKILKLYILLLESLLNDKRIMANSMVHDDEEDFFLI